MTAIKFTKPVNFDQRAGCRPGHSRPITARLAVIGDREFGNAPAACRGSAMPQYQPIAATHLSNIERPRCAKCQTRMLLSEVTSGPNGFDYRTFECQKCGHVHAISVSQDPM
jgi:hypothetical protein